ncbi:hypothetical protein N7475_007222 [Penicillium sp. IBT 31633x]|nr:hypothetical protein N7475_007222 [Penicillium sp. IBT 31633x]
MRTHPSHSGRTTLKRCLRCMWDIPENRSVFNRVWRIGLPVRSAALKPYILHGQYLICPHPLSDTLGISRKHSRSVLYMRYHVALYVTIKIRRKKRLAYNHFTSFTLKWERETSRSLPREVKDDVIIYRVADGAFKGLTTITEVLTIKLSNRREL